MPQGAHPLFDLSGKVALITGSTRGIGLAIAERMAEHGAKVVISSRKADVCEQVGGELAAKGHEVLVKPCNIARKEELQALVDATLAKWGRIDVLVCNAATNPVYGPSNEMSDEAWDKIMGTNVKSVWQLCNMVLPGMAERRDGAVVMISSIAGIRGNGVIGCYAVSKAAEAQLARNLAVEWSRYNIRINAIAPGLVKTDFARALWENPELLKRTEALAPLKRIGEPDDIAGVAVMLASRAGRFMTGQYIPVDGGVTIADAL